MEKFSLGLISYKPNYFHEFKENLLSGTKYYRDLAEQFVEEKRKNFLDELKALVEKIEQHFPPAETSGSGPNCDRR